jgi:hypothetical protein
MEVLPSHQRAFEINTTTTLRSLTEHHLIGG